MVSPSATSTVLASTATSAGDCGKRPWRRPSGWLGLPGVTPISCSSSGLPATVALAERTASGPTAPTPSTAATCSVTAGSRRLAWMFARAVPEYTRPSAGRDSMAPVKDRNRAPERLDRKTMRKTRRATAAVSRPKRSFARLISVRARFTFSSVRDEPEQCQLNLFTTCAMSARFPRYPPRSGTPLTFGDETGDSGESGRRTLAARA